VDRGVSALAERLRLIAPEFRSCLRTVECWDTVARGPGKWNLNGSCSDFALENIPIVNIQEEVTTHKALLADDEFRKRLLNIRDPVETPYLIWKGLPKNLLTYFLQRAILGVEACVSAAAWEARALDLFTDELAQKMEDPFRLRGQGTADVFYNRLPGLLDPEYALERCDPRLWATTKQFYKEIRNPLFHGYQLYRPEAEQVSEALALLDSVQAWIETWCRWHRGFESKMSPSS